MHTIKQHSILSFTDHCGLVALSFRFRINHFDFDFLFLYVMYTTQ